MAGNKAQPVLSWTCAARKLASACDREVAQMTDATCRLCRAVLTETFVDLGMSPLCESFVSADRLDGPETFYPLHVRICSECLLVQLPAYVPGEDIFSDYAYFSSYSDSWVEHARRYAVEMTERLGLGPDSLV